MSIIKATDVAYIRLRAPETAPMQAFLKDFGMRTVPAEGPGLFMRGAGSAPFIHVTEPGPAGFVAVGLSARSEADLAILAKAEGVEVEPLDAPGGGQVVRLTDPDGVSVEVVAGQTPSAVLPTPKPPPWNEGPDRARIFTNRRTRTGPSHVLRLGHVVFGVADFRRSEAWYKERFGLLTSDAIQIAPDISIGAFLRCDRGDEPCDHHTLFLLERPGPTGFMHAAYEVAGVDDLMAGHDHLKQSGYSHLWGVGRHILGSQIFDYWLDPYGNEIEHWTDGDQLRARDGAGIATVHELMGVQWGMPMPPIEGGPPA